MKFIKEFIKNFIRNRIRNLKYFKKRIYIEESLTSSVLYFNNYIENKHKENFINILDVGCFGQIPEYFETLRNFNFYGIDIDTEEINRQIKYYKERKFNFFNYKVVEPDNLEELRKNFVEPALKKDHYVIEKVQCYLHNISSSKLSDLNKNQNYTNNYFTKKKITIDDAVYNLINPKEINFLKIDIDSNDHEVLYGADNLLDNDNFFGLQIEVDFAKVKDNTYRNYIEVLRYMNSKNFNLINFVNYKYSSELLPTKYLYNFPGPNDNGSPLMGDLVFFKNFDDKFLEKLSEDDVIKILRLLEIYNQAHIAIELINRTKNFTEDKKKEFKSELIKKYSLDFFGKVFDYEEYCKEYSKNKDHFINLI